MTHVLAAILAALSVDTSFAPTIVYPPSAWTNVVRSSSVPGSVAFSNATRRLDAHASAAMFGTYDALVARQILPCLVNYGESRGKSIGDVAAGFRVTETNKTLDSDMTWHDSNGLVSAPFTDPSYRDFSGLGYRFGRIKELFDDDIIGDGNPKYGSFLGEYLRLDRSYSSAWLVPDIDHDSLVKDGWQIDDEAATADWNGYLLTMAELVATNIPQFANASPFGIYSAQSVLPRRIVDTESYLVSGGFPSARTVAGMFPFDDSPIGSIRGRKHDTLGKMMTERSSGIDFSSMTNRPSSRVWWERQAFANSLLSCCSKLMLFWQRNYAPAMTNDIVGSFGRSPNFIFRVRQPSGTVHGEITKEIRGKRGQIPLVTDRDRQECYFYFDPSDYEVTSFTNSSAISVSTNYTDFCDAAYRDRDTTGSLSIRVDVTMTRDSFGPIIDVLGEGRYELTGEFYADNDSYIPYPRLIFGNNVVCAWSGTTNWTSVIMASYSANAEGNIPLDVAQFIGPTQHECGTIDEDKWGEFSTEPFVPHRMLFDSGVIASASIHSYDSVGVSTNASVIEGVSTGSQFYFTNAKDNGTSRKDCWAIFRQRVIMSDIRDSDSLSAFLRRAATSWEGDMRVAFDMAHIDYPFPDYAAAVNVSRSDMSEILDMNVQSRRFVVSTGTGGKGGFETGINLVKDENGVRLVWRLSGREVKAGDVIGIWKVEYTTVPITVGSRRSAAIHFESNPFYILNLDFKKMTYEKD